jgi:hypothetical protein
MNLFNHKLFRLFIFMILMNLEDIIELNPPNILTVLIYLILGILLVYYFVPKWQDQDRKNK